MQVKGRGDLPLKKKGRKGLRQPGLSPGRPRAGFSGYRETGTAARLPGYVPQLINEDKKER